MTRVIRPGRQADAAPHRSFALGGLVLLTLSVFGLYMLDIDAKSIWWDESLSLYRAQHDLGYILSGRIDFQGASSTDLHPPLYFMLLRCWILLGGESDLVLRFPSALFATLLVPLLYALGARLRNRRTGYLAAVIGSMSPFLLWYAQEARMYTMVTFLATASLYSLLRAFQDRRWQWGLAFGLTATLALATQYLIALVLAVQVTLIFFLWPRRRRSVMAINRDSGPSRRTLTLIGTCVGAAILLAILIVREALGLAFWPKAGRQFIPLDQMLADAVHAFCFGLTVKRSVAWPLDLFALALYAVGVYSLVRQPIDRANRLIRWTGPILLLGTILAPILAMWAYSIFVGPLYLGSRYIIMSSPAFYLGMAIGLDLVADRTRWLSVLSLAVVLAGMGMANRQYFSSPEFATKEDHRSSARIVAANERAGDIVLVTAPENIPAFRHYYDGEMPVIGVPSVAMSGASDPEMIDSDLTKILDGPYDRVWLVHCRTMFSDPEDLVTAWLDEHAMLLERTYFPSSGSTATVSVYLTDSPIVQSTGGQKPVGVFGAALALESVTLRYRSADGTIVNRSPGDDGQSRATDQASAVAGRSVSAILTWCPERILGSYKTSLRIIDDNGVIWAQRDQEPYTYWPTDEWPVDATIRQEQDVRIPYGIPPSTYRLQLVVYESESGQALAYQDLRTRQESAFLDLGPLDVVPGTREDRRGDVLPDQVRRPLFDAVYGGDVALWAWDMAPASVAPGQFLYLSLYWKALRVPRSDYDLIVNWCDEEGAIWHTTRVSPTGVAYPTTRWREGQLLQGALRLSVPSDAPPGENAIHLLIADRNTGEVLSMRRGPLLWAGHDLRIGTITVE